MLGELDFVIELVGVVCEKVLFEQFAGDHWVRVNRLSLVVSRWMLSLFVSRCMLLWLVFVPESNQLKLFCNRVNKTSQPFIKQFPLLNLNQ